MPTVCQFRRTVPAAGAIASPALRPFSVSFAFDGQEHEINVLAFSSCDATCSAIDAFFDGEDEMPSGGMSIKTRPLTLLRA